MASARPPSPRSTHAWRRLRLIEQQCRPTTHVSGACFGPSIERQRRPGRAHARACASRANKWRPLAGAPAASRASGSKQVRFGLQGEIALALSGTGVEACARGAGTAAPPTAVSAISLASFSPPPLQRGRAPCKRRASTVHADLAAQFTPRVRRHRRAAARVGANGCAARADARRVFMSGRPLCCVQAASGRRHQRCWF